MLDSIFEHRDKKLNKILKVGSFLGRALRENVELFKFDAETERAFYLTESKKIISGKIVENILSNIEVLDSSTYLDEKKFNKLVENHINKWLGDLYRDKYTDAQKDFTITLSLWEERLKLEKINKILEQKATNVSEHKDILKTPQFKKLVEITPSLVKFLKENKDKISSIAEIKNGVILSNTVANAFGLPKLSYKKLQEAKKFEIDGDENSSTIFDLITKQELIKKELLESKKNFDSIWITDKKITKLANCINEGEDETQKVLASVINSIPYFTILSKKQLSEMFNTILNVSDEVVPFKEIQKYASYIFEAKKSVRSEVIKVLNEKYGINVQNLKDAPSYRSLLNTQIVIFETLRRLLPKDSINRSVLKEAIGVLKEKDGVEAIDVNDLINKIFTEATYSFISEAVMSRYLDFDRIADDLGSVSQILKMIKGASGGMQKPELGMGGSQGMPGNPMGMGQPQMGGAGQSPIGANPMQSPMANRGEEDLGGPDGLPTPEDDEEGIESGMGGGMSGGMGQDPMGGMDTPPTETPPDQMAMLMAELDEILNGLKVELGQDPEAEANGFDPGMDGEGEPGMEPGMQPEGGEMPMEGDPEGEEGFGEEEGEEGEDFDPEEEEDVKDDNTGGKPSFGKGKPSFGKEKGGEKPSKGGESKNPKKDKKSSKDKKEPE